MTDKETEVSPALSLRDRFLRDVKNTLDRGGWPAAKEKIGDVFDQMASDELTDLFTPRIFNRILAEIIMPKMQRKHHQQAGPLGAVVYIDIDFFKRINAQFGHAGGNEILRVFGKKLKAKFRLSDVIGRVGGDEFVIIADGLSVDAVQERITCLRADLSVHPWELERIDGGDRSASCELTFTCNVVEITDPSILEELIRKADAAVMQEKQKRGQSE